MVLEKGLGVLFQDVVDEEGEWGSVCLVGVDFGPWCAYAQVFGVGDFNYGCKKEGFELHVFFYVRGVWAKDLCEKLPFREVIPFVHQVEVDMVKDHHGVGVVDGGHLV